MLLAFGGVERARFKTRINRFLVELEDGRLAHLHDPGRLRELLVPGRSLVVRQISKNKRKTNLDVLAVRTRCWVFVHSGYHSRIAEILIPKVFSPIKAREVRLGSSRIDFLLEDGRLLEVKGCTLVRGGTALFPDAPTIRGTRHVREIARHRGALLFLVFHPEARELRPNCQADPRFCEAMRDAKDLVEMRAMRIRTKLVGGKLILEKAGEIPVRI